MVEIDVQFDWYIMAVSFDLFYPGAVAVEYFTEMSRYQVAANPLNKQNQRSSLELMLYTYLSFFSMAGMKGIKAKNNIPY